ncbi:antitoxin family protein [Candidatus Poribacteria bacterium]
MTKTIKARYKNGIIEPLEKLDIIDGSEITITLEDVSPSLTEDGKRERFLSSAGSWKDIVDEAFLEGIYNQRSLRTRPGVEL